jgi:hypothetical protein
MPLLPIPTFQVLSAPAIRPIMRTLALVSSFMALLSAFVSPLQAIDVDTFISTEGPIAKAGLLANIGSSGSKAGGALPGIVRTTFIRGLDH